MDCVSIGQLPHSLAFWFVVLELALEVATIWVRPSTFTKPVLHPFSNIFHASGIEDVGSLSMFFAIEPVSTVNVLVGVNEHSFTLFFTIIPLAVILALVSINQPSNSTLQVIFELASIYIPIWVGVFSLPTPQLNKMVITPSRYYPSYCSPLG